MYLDSDGNSYPQIAIPGQVLIKFDNIGEHNQEYIIEDCGGKIIEYYPLLRTYLVEVIPGNEINFITSSREHAGVIDVHLNSVTFPTSVKFHIIDDFSNNMTNSDVTHGDYVHTSAKSAYPECADCIINFNHDVEGAFETSKESKLLQEIFSSKDSDELILINMSYGNYILELDKETNNYVKKDNGEYVHIPWTKTFQHENGDIERLYWKQNVLGKIQWYADQLLTLSKECKNRNFLVFRASGNDYCHEMDDYIFSELSQKLTSAELEIIDNHFIFVSAKDDSRIRQGELAADYANSPSKYCSYMTMADISHLSHDGTSFSCPYLLGMVAKRFDKVGYKPISSNKTEGVTVLEMMQHIKNTTRNYAFTNQQPGLYTDNFNIDTYFFNKRYSFNGILKSDIEDLCETGEPETFYYIEIDPINIAAEDNSDFEEPLSNINKLQLRVYEPEGHVGDRITVSGELKFHIAGCHIHTDAYLENIVFENIENNNRDESNSDMVPLIDILVSSCSGLNPNSPENIARKFCKAVFENDMQTAKTYMDPEYARRAPDNIKLTDFEFNELKENLSKASCKVIPSEYTERVVTVRFYDPDKTYLAKDNRWLCASVELIQTDEGWKVTEYGY